MTDNDVRSNLRTAADQFGAAVGEALKQGMRQALANQIAEDYGPGPWVLHPDGSIETYVAPPTPITKNPHVRRKPKADL